jgi:hypothetical protein
MHAVCKNPEEYRLWKDVSGDRSLKLARYTYAELETAGTSCAKKCAAKAKCVAFEYVYDDDLTRVEECAPAHVHICSDALQILVIPLAAACSLCQCWRINGAESFSAMGGTVSSLLKAFQCAPLLTAFAYCRCYLFGENIFTAKGGLHPFLNPDYSLRELYLVKCFKPKPGAQAHAPVLVLQAGWSMHQSGSQ